MQGNRAILAFTVLCAGCASGPPEWVANPSADEGFAATECVRDSGRLSADRQVALGKARAGIARQFDQRVAAMDKAWAGLRDPGAATQPGGATPFALVAKPVAEQMLAGLPPSRVEYVDIDDVRQLCAMVTVEDEQAKQVFERVLTASGETIDAAAHDALYKEFSGAAPR
jgi:hypothetical protein